MGSLSAAASPAGSGQRAGSPSGGRVLPRRAAGVVPSAEQWPLSTAKLWRGTTPRRANKPRSPGSNGSTPVAARESAQAFPFPVARRPGGRASRRAFPALPARGRRSLATPDVWAGPPPPPLGRGRMGGGHPFPKFMPLLVRRPEPR